MFLIVASFTRDNSILSAGRSCHRRPEDSGSPLTFWSKGLREGRLSQLLVTLRIYTQFGCTVAPESITCVFVLQLELTKRWRKKGKIGAWKGDSMSFIWLNLEITEKHTMELSCHLYWKNGDQGGYLKWLSILSPRAIFLSSLVCVVSKCLLHLFLFLPFPFPFLKAGSYCRAKSILQPLLPVQSSGSVSPRAAAVWRQGWSRARRCGAVARCFPPASRHFRVAKWGLRASAPRGG